MKIMVAIIIVNWNGKNMLRKCLESVKKNTFYRSYKVIVVDNASTDGSVKLVKKKFKWVDLIQNKKNYGFSKGNNIGIKYARKYNPKYFLLLNNDTKVMKGWLDELIKAAESYKKAGIFGCRQLTFQRKPTISAGWILPFGVKYYFGNQIKKVNWVSGACLLIKKEVIEKIGLFDEKYSPCYYEETDFEQRALKAGFEIVYVPNSIILHKGSATIKQLDDNFIFYTFYKNRFRCFKKKFPILLFMAAYFV
jgi:GT2 family glycosyltransferase